MNQPKKGLSPNEINQQLSMFREHDLSWRDGRVLAYVYNAGQEAEQVVKNAYLQYLSENALDPSTFPSTLSMEKDIVRIVADLLQGDDQVVGNFTTGGTESIMLAVKTARDWARENKPHIEQPEILMCRTAHAAFHKAAHYLGLNVKLVPFLENDYSADVPAMRAAINENTILLVASSPCYSHGIIDPVPEIAALAQEHGLLCHVDSCIGAFMLAYMRLLEFPVKPFDFSVPGVTSISADLHKYGYAAKGASVILHKNKELRRHQIFANLTTTGYAIINPTVLSSKSGGPLAAAWAILHYMGQEGYLKIVSQVAEGAKKLINGINQFPDLNVLGQPDMSIFAVESSTINVFQLSDVMRKKGWYMQPQFSSSANGQPNIHITLNHANVPHLDQLLADLEIGIQETKQLPQLDMKVIKSQIESLLKNAAPQEAAEALYALAGIEGSQLPGETAMINSILNILPSQVSEDLLISYFNDLYS